MVKDTHSKHEEPKKAEDSEQLDLIAAPENVTEQLQESSEPSFIEDPNEVSVQSEVVPNVDDVATEQQPAAVDSVPVAKHSVKADTHSKKRKKPKKIVTKLIETHVPDRVYPKKWTKVTGLVIGVLAVITIFTSGVLSQYFKGKTLPNVRVAGISSSAKSPDQIKTQLNSQVKGLKLTLQTKDKKFEPKSEEVGFQVNVEKTAQNALQAKRTTGILGKLAFWQTYNVPAVITVNDTLLNQYLEAHLPELSKPAQDAQLQFNPETNTFAITEQANGQGVDAAKVKTQLVAVSENLKSPNIEITTATKGPTITKTKLEPLVEHANSLVSRRIILTGLGYTYQARPADIASWVTPTPQKTGVVQLVIDPSKIQSYVDGLGKKISNAPVDKKVLKDETTGAEVVIQGGRDGTELADKQLLADSIAQALKNKEDITQTMNIKVAAYQTVNMNAYDKWIEVDLSEQRTTAYERATPVKNFLIASGTRGHETVVGEFSIWLKVRSQTMQGGSRADGSYYNIPNVEWVSYFYQDYALHGAWWRKQFGVPASHGCVNMTNSDAQWVYEWAPVGTKVIVHA